MRSDSQTVSLDVRRNTDRPGAAEENPDEMALRRLGVDTTVYAFGSPCDNFYGRLVFRADGTIAGYSHPNERRWRLEDGALVFLNDAGEPASRLRADGDAGCWLGTSNNSKWPLILAPVIKLDRSRPPAVDLPPVLINSIPKSGTYYLEAAFAELGWKPTRLHLGSGGALHDFRGLADEEIHVAPSRQRLNCPAELLAAILQPGDLLVGHIDANRDIEAFRSSGVFGISLVRDLRNALASLYRFKLSVVAPIDTGDRAWRQAHEADRFISFLAFHASRDVEFTKAVTEAIRNERDACRVRFEDIVSGLAGAEFGDRLERLQSGLSARLESALKARLRTKTPTYSGALSDWRTIWDDRAEQFFVDSGLQDLNAELGYERRKAAGRA